MSETVEEIVECWLKNNGYDGLCSYECGCRIGDLMPCGYTQDNCVAGYAVECAKCVKRDDCELNDPPSNWVILATKTLCQPEYETQEAEHSE